MTTIYLDPDQVPASLKGQYSGKQFKAVVTTTVDIHSDAGLWSGGSRDTWCGVDIGTGITQALPGQDASPWNEESPARHEQTIALMPGFAIIRHTMFCGKDMGLTFYVHPDNAARLIPAPAAELTTFEKFVLVATRSLKSSYGGRDRYEMACADYTCKRALMPVGTTEFVSNPSRAEWEAARLSLIGKKLLNKAGAITPAGRNVSQS